MVNKPFHFYNTCSYPSTLVICNLLDNKIAWYVLQDLLETSVFFLESLSTLLSKWNTLSDVKVVGFVEYKIMM